MGAKPDSVVFYNRVKGEMEHAVAALGFQTLVIARPSLLDGGRETLAQPARPAERLGLAVMRAVRLLIPANLRAVAASDVARSLVQAVKTRGPGLHLLLSGALHRH